jgi:hypothetical protein
MSLLRALVPLLLVINPLDAALPAPLTPPDYLGLSTSLLSLYDAGWRDSTCLTKPAAAPCDGATVLAACHAHHIALQPNATATALPRISHLLLLFVASWRNATANGTLPNADEWDFFACGPLVTAYGPLLTVPGGLANWTAQDQADLMAAAEDVCGPQMNGTYNQPASRAAGSAAFAALFPASPIASSAKAYAQGVWEDWTTGGGAGTPSPSSAHTYAEDAPIYNSIFLHELAALGQALSPQAFAADMQTPETRALFTHFRDLVGPSGRIPTYGDGWAGAGGSGFPGDASPWSVEELPHWPALFELAAAAYQDEAPAFAWAAASYAYLATGALEAKGTLGLARRVAAHSSSSDPLPLTLPVPSTDDMRGLIQLFRAAAWRSEPPVAPVYFGDGPCPSVTTRRTVVSPATPDKLILGTSRAPCADDPTNASSSAPPYLMAELLAEGYHAHPLQIGSLLVYVAGGVTYVHNAGRDNRATEAASGMALWPDLSNVTGFPFREVGNQIRSGMPWALAELPTVHAQPPLSHPSSALLRNLTNLGVNIHNSVRGDNVTLFVGYVTLFNPDTGAELLLDDFDPASGQSPAWTPSGAKSSTVVRDATLPRGSGFALQLVCTSTWCSAARPPSATRPMPGVVPFAEWPYVRFYYRLVCGKGTEEPVGSTNTSCGFGDVVRAGTGPYYQEGPFNTVSTNSNWDWEPEGQGPGGHWDAPAPSGAGAAEVEEGVAPPTPPGYAVEVLSPSFAANVTSAVAAKGTPPAAGAGDTFGSYALAHYRSTGVTWTRSLVLLAEGPLVVVDALTVQAGDRADGAWLAGPSFLLQVATDPVEVTTAGEGSFAWDAVGFNRTGCLGNGTDVDPSAHLLVWMSALPGLAVTGGSTRTTLAGNIFPVSVFSRTVAPIGASSTFVSVLLPHDVSQGASGLAQALAVEVGAQGAAVVTVPLPGGVATVTVGGGGWGVARQ